MSWPNPQDYSEEIQNPNSAFRDEVLQEAKPALDSIGLPQVASGNFASVYQLKCSDKVWALRCFLQPVTDQAERYRRLSEFISNDKLPYTVDFQYLEQGIKVGSAWFPVLKMEWVNGITLDQYIREHWQNKSRIDALARNFKSMMQDLRRAQLAHGDLQHGNIMLAGEDLRLVDYDDMFVPALHGRKSNALGHRNYQHPARRDTDFGPHIDNFSSWVIYSSLQALSNDPDLCIRLSSWDDCMLFKHDDYELPEKSKAFSYCVKHTDDSIRIATSCLINNLARGLLEIPFLDDEPTNGVAEEKAALSKIQNRNNCGEKLENQPDASDLKTQFESTHDKISVATELKETASLKVMASFALPAQVPAPAPAKGSSQDLALSWRDELVRLSEIGLENNERRIAIAKAVREILMKSNKIEALLQGNLDLTWYAEQIEPEVSSLTGLKGRNFIEEQLLHDVDYELVRLAVRITTSSSTMRTTLSAESFVDSLLDGTTVFWNERLLRLRNRELFYDCKCLVVLCGIAFLLFGLAGTLATLAGGIFWIKYMLDGITERHSYYARTLAQKRMTPAVVRVKIGMDELPAVYPKEIVISGSTINVSVKQKQFSDSNEELQRTLKHNHNYTVNLLLDKDYCPMAMIMDKAFFWLV